jgi:hypothetical protein
MVVGDLHAGGPGQVPVTDSTSKGRLRLGLTTAGGAAGNLSVNGKYKLTATRPRPKCRQVRK